MRFIMSLLATAVAVSATPAAFPNAAVRLHTLQTQSHMLIRRQANQEAPTPVLKVETLYQYLQLSH